MNHGILAEHDIETLVRQRERTGVDFLIAQVFGKALPLGAFNATPQQRTFDIDTVHMGRVEVAHQNHVTASDAATDVEDLLSRDIETFEKESDLLLAARRKESVAPNQFQGADKAVGVFVFLVIAHDDCLSFAFRMTGVLMAGPQSVGRQ